MKLLIKDAIPIGFKDKHSRQDILFENGVISALGKVNNDDINSIFGKEIYISPGWVDLRTLTNDPGNDQRDDLSSVSVAGSSGGFTHLFCLPNTDPVIQGKESINYLLKYNSDFPIKLIPMPVATRDVKGSDMINLLDLSQAGLRAFGDGNVAITRADSVILLLQYLSQFNGTLFQFPHDPLFKEFGLVHEGVVSAAIGLKGIPSLAEYLLVKRDLDLLRECGGKIHFSCITVKESVAAIRNAKLEGLHVTCDTAAHYLAFSEHDLISFDANLKVFPPYRSLEDIEALKVGLNDGTIDAVVSDHQGVDFESKNLEFDLADFGVSTLETTFSALNTYSNLSPERIVEKLSVNPRGILGLHLPQLKIGEKCDFTIFSVNEENVFDSSQLRSKSLNNPFLGKRLKGKVLATCLGQKIFVNDQH